MNKKRSIQTIILFTWMLTHAVLETILIGTHSIVNDAETILLDGDTFYGIDILAMYRMSKQKNMVFCFQQSDDRPVYSYVGFSENKIINKIAEKNRITEFANTGCYVFAKLSELRRYCKKIIDDDLRFGNEFYMSRVYQK